MTLNILKSRSLIKDWCVCLVNWWDSCIGI